MRMRMGLASGGLLVVCCCLSGGCALMDLNYNPEARYEMALRHAGRAMRESNSTLEPSHPDYDLMKFRRLFYDEATHTVHDLELYDSLKTSPKPGPDRFVIAYDFTTRKTYLRTDLRSNENIDRLPSSQPAND